MKIQRDMTAAAFSVATIFAITSPVSAVPINYGDFSGTTVMFSQVTEDSGTDPTPLFGAPTVSGDALDFNPVSFNSSSTGAAGTDITDGTLTLMMMSHAGNFIDQIEFDEAGDFTLSGLSGNAFASVTATFFLDIVEVDGLAITPVNISTAMVFSPSGGDWSLLADGPGPLVNGPWSGFLNVDITQALIDNNIPYDVGATKVFVTFDNTLTTLSEAGTSAFIAKKDVGGVGITVTPEPASLGLLALGALAIMGRRNA